MIFFKILAFHLYILYLTVFKIIAGFSKEQILHTDSLNRCVNQYEDFNYLFYKLITKDLSHAHAYLSLFVCIFSFFPYPFQTLLPIHALI